MVFLPFQLFLKSKGEIGSTVGDGETTYKDVFEALRSLDDLVVTGPQFLARKFHELCGDDAPTRGRRLAYMGKVKMGMERTRRRSCRPASANAT